MKTPTQGLLAILAIVCYSALLIAAARTRLPMIDEALYALPAWNLATTGSTGTPVVEPTGHATRPQLTGALPGFREHSYWILPVNFLVGAAWYKVFGFGLVQARLISLTFGFVVLALWFLLIRHLTSNPAVALLAVALIAIDPVFVSTATNGRMDMMSASFAFGAITWYLCVRQRSLDWAILGGQSLVALAAFTHPNALMVGFVGSAVLVFDMDRKRLRWKHAFIAAAPYVAGLLCMAPYVLHDPAAFVEQLRCNGGGRLDAIAAPLMIIPNELSRYFVCYGLNPEAPLRSWIKGIVLLTYVASLVVVLRNPVLRGRLRPVLLMAASTFVMLALLENMKWTFYMIYMVPMMAAAAAIAAGEWAGRFPRLVKGVVVLFVLMMVSGTVLRIRANPYLHEYQPIVDFLKANATDNTLVMGGSDLVFGYGIRPNLVDDIRLGYRSGKQPDFVVCDGRFGGVIEEFRSVDPAIYKYIRGYLDTQCVRVPVGSNSVFVRKQSLPHVGASGQ